MRYQRFQPGATPNLTLASWLLLAFVSGCINVGGLIACGRFVSHVTGFPTLFGLDAASGRFDIAAGILSVPLFFLGGVLVSASQIDRRLQQHKRPRYGLVFALVVVCLSLVSIGGSYGLFGTFGAPARLQHDYFFLALLCMASGLQNAAVTTVSGSAMRVSHLTGTMTDLGIDLMRVWTPGHPLLPREVRANIFRAGTLLSFTAGAWLGALVFLRYHYWGFLFPALLVAPAAWGTLSGVPKDHAAKAAS